MNQHFVGVTNGGHVVKIEYINPDAWQACNDKFISFLLKPLYDIYPGRAFLRVQNLSGSREFRESVLPGSPTMTVTFEDYQQFLAELAEDYENEL